MGYARQPAPRAIRSADVVFVITSEIAAVIRASDPFEIENVCELSPTGQHAAIGSCGDVVCCHCAKVFWQ
jgi:hypothetical protein